MKELMELEQKLLIQLMKFHHQPKIQLNIKKIKKHKIYMMRLKINLKFIVKTCLKNFK